MTLVGEDPTDTVLTYDDNASGAGGTADSASVTVFADGFVARDLTFENTAPPFAQKVALLAYGDRQLYRNCQFLSHQDTLYAGGPANRQYFLDCYVEWTVDFVFGDAAAVFDGCELYCMRGGSHVTAANTLPEYDTGLVFKHCRVRGDAQSRSFTLGRPWGPTRGPSSPTAISAMSSRSAGGRTGVAPTMTRRRTTRSSRTAGRVQARRAPRLGHVLPEERLGTFHVVFDEWDLLGNGDWRPPRCGQDRGPGLCRHRIEQPRR